MEDGRPRPIALQLQLDKPTGGGRLTASFLYLSNQSLARSILFLMEDGAALARFVHSIA